VAHDNIYDYSSDVMSVMFAERQGQILLAKPNLLLERKSINVKVLFIIIKKSET